MRREQQRITLSSAAKLLASAAGSSCLSQPGETVRGQVLESLGCWLKMSGGIDLPAGLPDSPLVTAALDGLGVDGTFHAAVDAVRMAS